MIEKNNNNSFESNSCKLLEQDEIEISNFKLFCRNSPNPETDRSSGVSSDEETTSSSLVPIPDTLKHVRNKSKTTANEAGDHCELTDVYARGILKNSAGNIMSSLEELRQKYTLKAEASVALKMNSANLILDDILSRTNVNKTSNESFETKFSKKKNFKRKALSENESSTTENSVSQTEPCAHMIEHSHIPIAVDHFSPPCHRHCSATISLQKISGSIKRDCFTPKKDLESSQRKKSILKKLQELQVKCRIQSVFRSLQKAKSPVVSRSKKDVEGNVQGIPGSGYRADEVGNECKHKKPFEQYTKKMNLDLIEPGDGSDSKSTARLEKQYTAQGEKWQCTCWNTREHQRVAVRENRHWTCPNPKEEQQCSCPEVIPKCSCVEQSCKISEFTSKNRKGNSVQCPGRDDDFVQSPIFAPGTLIKNHDESSSLSEKESKDSKEKENSLGKNVKGWKKYCSRERNFIEKTDFYYFDHGNSAFYRTTDSHPTRYTECLLEQTDEYATRFWAEIFGTIEIGMAFLISFILQLHRFLFTSIVRSLLVGLLQIFSDYFFKPLLTILFNGLIQPCLILAYNIATSFRDLCLPISQTFGFFAKEVANIFRSCRLVEFNHLDRQSTCSCGNKV